MADAYGNINCGDSKKFMVVCDSGGSNEWRTGLRKYQLALLATEPGKEIHVYHTPHGTSKRNKAEHRLFCYITKTEQGNRYWTSKLRFGRKLQLTVSEVPKQKSLTVKYVADTSKYECSIRISDEEIETIDLDRI